MHPLALLHVLFPCAGRAWKVAAYRKLALDITNIADAAVRWALKPQSLVRYMYATRAVYIRFNSSLSGLPLFKAADHVLRQSRRAGTLHCINSRPAQLRTVHPHPRSINTMSDSEYTLYYWPGGHIFRGPLHDRGSRKSSPPRCTQAFLDEVGGRYSQMLL